MLGLFLIVTMTQFLGPQLLCDQETRIDPLRVAMASPSGTGHKTGSFGSFPRSPKKHPSTWDNLRASGDILTGQIDQWQTQGQAVIWDSLSESF